MESRIKRNIYILIGVTVLLLLAMIAGWFFALVRPQKDTLAQVQKQYQDRKAVAGRLETALSEQKKTEDRKGYLLGQLAFFRQRYRNLYFGDIGSGSSTDAPLQKAARIQLWRRWLNEYFSEYGLALRSSLLEIADASKVTITTAIKVDAPPKAPEEITAPANGLFKPTGGTSLTVTVTGPLENVMDFFNRVNRSPILMVIGTIKLSTPTAAAGQNAAAPATISTGPPMIQASFTATPYLMASGPGVPLGGSAAAGAAAAGAVTTPGAPGSAAGAPGSTSGSTANSASTTNSVSNSATP